MLIALPAMTMAAPAARPPRGADCAAVRRVVETENRMYATYDASVARQVYAPDIRWQNPFGVRLIGEPAVERFLIRLFSRPGFRSAKEVRAPVITDVRLLSPTTASAWSEEASEGQTRADGSPVGVRKSHILYVLGRSNGRWFITDELIMDERE